MSVKAMEKKICFVLTVWLFLFSDVRASISIEQINLDVNITQTDNNVFAQMNENNHNFKQSTPLFKISVTTGECKSLDVVFLENTFKYVIKEDCIFYSLQPFDYELNQRTYLFQIEDNLENKVNIRLNIINIDDEDPTITSIKCEFNEITTYTIENTSCSCSVLDPDGWLYKTTFQIYPGDAQEDKTFKLEFKEPPGDDVYEAPVYMYPVEILHYEINNFYLFSISATDSANHVSVHQSAVVNVKDLRNTNPVWRTITKFMEFKEKTAIKYTVKATDGDTGINAKICYFKNDGDPYNAVHINEESGVIDVDAIDRDKDDITLYTFNMSACVCKETNWCTRENVQFYIEDIDDNPPRLMKNKFDNKTEEDLPSDGTKTIELSYLENYEKSYNFTTEIVDIDTGENAQFTVDLEKWEGGEIDYTQAYIIVPNTGYKTGEFRISVKNKTYLDFENEDWKVHKYYIVSHGVLDKSKTDRMLVSVSLEDYNDEYPIFKHSSYETSINETTKKGVFVLQANATDRDAEDSTLAMNIVGSYAEERLSIDSDGNIEVKIDDAFDYDILKSIYFQVTATDKVNHVTSVPVTINLLDVNNKAPTIDRVQQVEVEENQKNGVYLNLTVTASDIDTTGYLVAYIIWESSYVTKSSGEIEITQEVETAMKFLEVDSVQDNEGRSISVRFKVVNNNDDNPDKPDYETFDTLYLNLTVEDLHTDPEFEDKRKTSAIISINIKDINDNPPYFPESNSDNRTVQEVASASTSVGFIKAIDPDLIDKHTSYYCTAEDKNFDWVNVNTTTGAFSVKADNLTNADDPPTWYFNYTCWAYDGKFFSKPIFVSIYVIDINNQIPSTNFTDEVSVTEKSAANTHVSNVYTSDMDRDIPFHTVRCYFSPLDAATTECAQQFVIDKNIITVINGGDNIDRDHGRPSFTCHMECKDNEYNERSQGMLKTSKTFTIRLIDVNDHTPELDTKNLDCSENTDKDSDVGTIRGTDIDEGDNAAIVFSIVSIISIETGEDITAVFGIDQRDDYKYNETMKVVHLVANENLKGHYGTYNVTLHLEDKGDHPRGGDYILKLTINKFNYESPKIIFPTADNLYQLLSSQKPKEILKYYKGSADFPDFSATDGATSDCSKWDVGFSIIQETHKEDDIFRLVRLESCKYQLQVNDNFQSADVLKKIYNLTVTAEIKDGTAKDGEAPYSTSVRIGLTFIDNTLQPIFKDTNWNVNLLENDTTQVKPLEHSATYDVPDSETFPIYYFLVTDNDTIKTLFNVEENSGSLSVVNKFYYDYDKGFQFQIVASNDSVPSSTKLDSYLNVNVTVLDTNRRTPYWKNDKYFGAIMPDYKSNILVISAKAYDDDEIDQGKLTFSIKGDVERHGTGLTEIKDPPFYVETKNDTGNVYTSFAVKSTMSGYFSFKLTVSDPPDDYGHGPHVNETTATIFIITTANTVDFEFYNDINDVYDNEEQMLKIVSEFIKYDAYCQTVDTSNNNNSQSVTVARLYFINNIDGDSVGLIDRDDILKIVSNINTFTSLSNKLKSDLKLFLAIFPQTNKNTGNSEAVLKAWLTGVSVVMGVICLILLLTLLLKTRQLNKRISKLTTKKFGSQESGLNRIGVSAPNTNKHAIEGSNPIYKNEETKKPKELSDFETQSVRSGDSDLIGVEDNPEFDLNFGGRPDQTTYL